MTRTRLTWTLLTGLAACLTGFAQYPVDPALIGHRLVAVVPLTGTGIAADAKRPASAPLPKDLRQITGLQSFSWQPSDDGTYAIVEYVFTDRAAFEAMLADKRALKVFEKGKEKASDIEREVRKYRKDYSVNPLAVGILAVAN